MGFSPGWFWRQAEPGTPWSLLLAPVVSGSIRLMVTVSEHVVEACSLVGSSASLLLVPAAVTRNS